MEEQIVEYLKSKYNPHAILLGGSRVSENHTKESDWDIFVFTPDKYMGDFVEWNGELLDITFREVPTEDAVLSGPYQPLWPVKVLFDGTDGVLEKVLENTKAKHDEGPLRAYPDACSNRLRQLKRAIHKVKKYEDNQRLQFYYLTYSYYFLIRSWFEQSDLWPLPPREAFSYIEKSDKEFAVLLDKIMESRGSELSDYVESAVRRIESLSHI